MGKEKPVNLREWEDRISQWGPVAVLSQGPRIWELWDKCLQRLKVARPRLSSNECVLLKDFIDAHDGYVSVDFLQELLGIAVSLDKETDEDEELIFELFLEKNDQWSWHDSMKILAAKLRKCYFESNLFSLAFPDRHVRWFLDYSLEKVQGVIDRLTPEAIARGDWPSGDNDLYLVNLKRALDIILGGQETSYLEPVKQLLLTLSFKTLDGHSKVCLEWNAFHAFLRIGEIRGLLEHAYMILDSLAAEEAAYAPAPPPMVI